MAEENKTNNTPKDVMGFLDYWLVKKAPFQIPENAKEWIVKYGPWIDLVLLVLVGLFVIPTLFAAIGLTAALSSYAAVYGGVGYTGWFWFTTAILGVQLLLQVFALPGLFARKMSGWTLLFYSEAVNLVYSLLSYNIVGGLIGAVIGFYVLFQIREKYSK